jgi:hypothetical protein
MMVRRPRDLSRTYDRAHEDVGNIVFLEHVNVTIPDQTRATAFYVQGLGFTRDPYVMTGVENMWINMGQTQFHLPTAKPQKVRGYVDLIVPDLDALARRLTGVKDILKGTQFDFCVLGPETIMAICPWGNKYRCHLPGPRFANHPIGIAQVEIPVEEGFANGICRFYRELIGATACVKENGGRAAHVRVSGTQELVFKETSEPIPDYEGYHVAVYITDFSGPHKKLRERDILTEESNPYQYRFEDVVDLDSNKTLCIIEHEVRSFTHPMYMRPLINRNPAQRQATYKPGRDAFIPGLV